MAVDIPAGVAHGHVTGYFGRSMPDSDDPGSTPDMTLYNGTVVFKAMLVPEYIRFPTLAPPLFLTVESVTGIIDNGVLRDSQGASGIEMISSFQDNGEPNYFQWEATVTLEATAVKIPPFRFEVPAGGTVDLAAFVPQARNSATQIIVSSEDRILAQEAAAQSQAIYDSIAGGIGPIIEAYLIAHPPTGSGVSSWNDLTDKPTTFPPSTHTHDVSQITSGWSTIGQQWTTVPNPANARSLIGAGTSDLTIGTTSATAKAGNWAPAYTDITGMVAPIPAFLGANGVTAARAAIGAADDAVVIKTTGAQTKAGVLTFSNSPVVPAGSWTIASTAGLQAVIDAKAPLASPTFTGTVSGVTKAMVGLSNVDNTSDAAKPISTATAAELDTKLSIVVYSGTAWPSRPAVAHVGWLDFSTTAPLPPAFVTGADVLLQQTVA